MKRVVGIYGAPRPDRIGSSLPVHSLFSCASHGRHLSPFLRLEQVGPHRLEPGERSCSRGPHAHRGFEAVTLVYAGEILHRDSTGARTTLGPGDVQWTTAASGIVHEESCTSGFARHGGTVELVHLWVNLPTQDKMGPAGCQSLYAAAIPSVALPDGAGKMRVIAGHYRGHDGPALTRTPMHVWDIRLGHGRQARLPADEDWTLAIVALKGAIRVNGRESLRESQMALFDRRGRDAFIEAECDATVLLLAGKPIDEPVAGNGPFVMNTEDELAQAFNDLHLGRFGHLPH
jgi:Pirin-related protein